MILHCEEAKYIRIVYNTMCNDMTTEPNIVNWCSLLRDLLFLIGLPGAWFFQDVGDVKLFLKIVKTQKNDIFLQHWHTRVDCSSRALFYKHVADFKFQPYSDSYEIVHTYFIDVFPYINSQATVCRYLHKCAILFPLAALVYRFEQG